MEGHRRDPLGRRLYETACIYVRKKIKKARYRVYGFRWLTGRPKMPPHPHPHSFSFFFGWSVKGDGRVEF